MCPLPAKINYEQNHNTYHLPAMHFTEMKLYRDESL